MPLTLAQVAELLGCPPPSAGPTAAREIHGIASLEDATDRDLTFVVSDAYLDRLAATRAAAAVVQRRVHLPHGLRLPVLLVDDADLAIARVLERFAPPVPRPPNGIDTAARIDPTAILAADVAIGPFVSVGPRSRVARGTILHPGVAIAADVTVGDDCELFANVVIRERVTIGRRVIIHAGSVIGSDGFGYRWDGRGLAKVPHAGTVVIEDDVEIGACVCIDRAKFSATRIGRGTKIDNLVQVGHNARIGAHCLIAGQAGIAGSAVIGDHVTLGGQAAVRDHVTIGHGASVAGRAAVAEDVAPGANVSGTPALPHRQSLREQAAFRQLPDLRVQVRKLKEELDKLKQALNTERGKRNN